MPRRAAQPTERQRRSRQCINPSRIYPVPATTPSTFTVTFAHASGSVPLSPAAFTIRDEFGHLHRPRVDGAPPTLAVPVGRLVTLTISAVLPTGNGQLTWTPAGKPVVSWDFDVEVD
jgi:hypothetical protein